MWPDFAGNVRTRAQDIGMVNLKTHVGCNTRRRTRCVPPGAWPISTHAPPLLYTIGVAHEMRALEQERHIKGCRKTCMCLTPVVSSGGRAQALQTGPSSQGRRIEAFRRRVAGLWQARICALSAAAQSTTGPTIKPWSPKKLMRFFPHDHIAARFSALHATRIHEFTIMRRFRERTNSEFAAVASR